MTVDDWLRKIRERRYRVSILQECGDGLWQAALRRGDRQFLPARCLTAVDALAEAFKRSEDGRLGHFKVVETDAPAVEPATDGDIFG